MKLPNYHLTRSKTLEQLVLSSVAYVLPMLLLSISHFISNRSLRAMLLAVSGYLIFVVMAFRDGIGWDYSTYYNAISYGLFEDWEPIPKFLANVAYKFKSPELFFIMTSAIVVASFLRISIGLASAVPLLCFLALPVFFFEAMTVVRQALSMAFAALAYFYFFRERKSFSCLFLIASVCSHLAAVPFVIFVFLLNFFSERTVRLAFLCALVLGLFFELALPFLSVYLPILNWYRSGATYGLISIVFWMAWLVVFFSRRESRDHYYCMTLGVLLSAVLIAFDSVLLRAFWYFYIPVLFLNYKHAFGNVRISPYFAVLCFWLSFSFTLYVKSAQTLGPALPYRTIIW